MNIKRYIDRNAKLIGYVILAIVMVLVAIKSLNAFYENKEEKKKAEIIQNEKDKLTQTPVKVNKTERNIENDSIDKTINSFVNYCNKKEFENAYKMLTKECKDAMFPTVDYFKKVYCDVIYNVERSYEMVKWSTDGNKTTYLIKLYGDLLSTGSTDKNYTEDYYTFVKDNNGIYKININNYIYGESRNIEKTVNGVTVKIEFVDVYEEYENVKITIINKSNKKISLTGDKYKENIYLENANGVTYSSLNSKFDSGELILKPNETQTLWVEFNKVYTATNKAAYLVLSDVILDYDAYLNSENRANYSYRTSIKVPYQK